MSHVDDAIKKLSLLKRKKNQEIQAIIDRNKMRCLIHGKANYDKYVMYEIDMVKEKYDEAIREIQKELDRERER